MDFSFFSNKECNLLMATGSDICKEFCSRYLEAILTNPFNFVLITFECVNYTRFQTTFLV
ncbi:hypothetical protein MmazTMA_09050 [Methanosarcina mazei]|nr:hypothetical protein MmazTMA_09050 [Methanosarcina mazei]